MFGFVANVQQSPFGFTFEDDGVFEAVGGAKADYMAFDRYSAPDYKSKFICSRGGTYVWRDGLYES
mgnify:CR=1 FL=1